MALRNEYGQFNLSDHDRILVKYWTEKSGDGYILRRTATRSYSYVGMTKDAAKICQAAKLSQYLRSYSIANSSKEKTDKVIKLGASISTSHSGDSWNVHIAVNESDSKYDTVPKTPSYAFSEESGRNYDLDFNDLKLTNVRRNPSNKTLIWFHVSYPDNEWYNNGVTIEYRLEGSPTWIARPSGGIGDYEWSFPADPFSMRLNWKNLIESETVYVP